MIDAPQDDGIGLPLRAWLNKLKTAVVGCLPKSGGTMTGAVDMVEITAPAAPSANTARIYVDDSGGGKTRLMVRFPSGSAVQIAIEP